MSLAPAITDLEQLKNWPVVFQLLAWRASAVQAVRYDRNELSITVERGAIRDACALLRDDPATRFNFLSDLTCVDWYPAEPRFEVVFHLLSIPNVRSQPPAGLGRVRLKVRLHGDDPRLESVTSVWPSANFFEREVFDLFGVRFEGHPYLRRLLMPENWDGNPLRKDYPVEGYR